MEAKVKDNDLATENFLVGGWVKAEATVETKAKLKVEAKVKDNDLATDNFLVGGWGGGKGKGGDKGKAEGEGKGKRNCKT